MQINLKNENPRIIEVTDEYDLYFGYAVTCWETTTIYHSGDPDADYAAAEEYLNALGEIE